MKLYDLQEAANFLKLNPEVVRKRAFKGDIPASKKTGRWLFVESDLIEWLRSGYGENKCFTEEKTKITSQQVIGGQTLHCTDSEYTKALALKTKH